MGIQNNNIRGDELNKFCRKYYIHGNHSSNGK